MNVYAESSAVLAWLLGEPAGSDAARALADAELIVASALTALECHRVLRRAVSAGGLVEGVAAQRMAALTAAQGHWAVMGLDDEILARAAHAFPREPVRTLDALHLATALAAAAAVPALTVLSHDTRIRDNATALGLAVTPG